MSAEPLTKPNFELQAEPGFFNKIGFSDFLGVIMGLNYKAMRIRYSSKSSRLMPISLNIIKLKFKSANTYASDSKKRGFLCPHKRFRHAFYLQKTQENHKIHPGKKVNGL
jgi:hypothetical protein